MKVGLHGNIVLDSVHELDGQVELGLPNKSVRHYNSVGAIGNVGRAPTDLGVEMYFDGFVGRDEWADFCTDRLVDMGQNRLSDTDDDTTLATILVSPGDKTSVVRWGACQAMSGFYNGKADWHHIAYLDALPNIQPEHLQDLTGTISADMCRQDHSFDERQRLFEFLPFLDCLIISMEEAMSLTGQHIMPSAQILGHRCKGWAVLHDAHGSIISNGSATITQHVEHQRPSNVLGAGDYFAAGFIASEAEEIADRVLDGHKMAEKLLS